MIDAQKREAFASFSTLLGRGKKETRSLVIRPPYAHNKELFNTICLTCKDTPCVGACEEEIIFLDENHTPCLLFTKSGCTFCEECAKACPHEVLHVKPESEAKIDVNVKIDMGKCIAWNGTICNSCGDACVPKAIKFFGMFRPIVEMDKCTGCGFCYGVCPANAVLIKGGVM